MTAALPHIHKRKLIEVALPLEVINRESAREKSIRHGHPSTLHLWWARRPLAAARAVLFAQLVDDPSSHPDRFPTDADIVTERKRLHDIIEKLVEWDNSDNDELFRQAHQEILDSTDGDPPRILDPFAGGGTIPLEAQRLGLNVDASDLNPVAVLINKALVEIPPRFIERPPVNPEARRLRGGSWPRATGLADDVRYYSRWMRDEAAQRIKIHYPSAKLDDGSEAPVIAWLWARTVTCPNPTCGIAMPLVRSWWLGRKKGREAWVAPFVDEKRVRYRICRSPETPPSSEKDGTVGRHGARCISCGAAVDLKYIRAEGQAGRLGADLMAIVVESRRSRHYLPVDDSQRDSAVTPRPESVPDGQLFDWPGRINVVRYGMTEFSDLFTLRQLTALTTFSDLVVEARARVQADALASGLEVGHALESNGVGAAAYADAVSTYLAFTVSKLAARNNTLCTWESGMDRLRGSFQRQAIPMTWDFAEANPLESSGGGFVAVAESECEVIDSLPVNRLARPAVTQQAAQHRTLGNVAISTDPPYYDNICYSDLSDFFYVWLRRSSASTYPTLLSTLLVPKADELVANQYRHGSKGKAQEFFENGFNQVFERARSEANLDVPATVYYAFKQVETTSGGVASTGWETLLQGMVSSGWAINATWPLRSELSSRMVGSGTNALASSIVLAVRPRPHDAPRTARRGFISSLKRELPNALRELQQGAISPVDLPQAAIGPGMAVFSRYSAVLNDDGTPMRVRSALSLINEVLDEVLAEQEGDFDPDTRFALAWFRQHGFDAGDFGDADNLARARNASLDHLERAGILSLRGTRGKVTLLAPSALDPEWDPMADTSISAWEVVMQLSRTLTDGGIAATSELLSRVPESIDLDLCKELSFLLFAISEDAKRTNAAIDFNALGTAWNDIAAGVRPTPEQGTFDYAGE